uniref:Ubiquitin-like protease family profile domain-containing protein n=1 Tax=Amphimedon queenslandica TaxID=400682 RepID=A0A1X7TLH4_AMPQE
MTNLHDPYAVSVINNGEVVGHWITTTTIGCSKGKAVVYDSLYTNIDKATQKLIIKALNCINLCITLPVVWRQKVALDCGLYAIAFATPLAFGHDLQTVQFDQTKMIDHLMKCIENKHYD